MYLSRLTEVSVIKQSYVDKLKLNENPFNSENFEKFPSIWMDLI